MKTASTKSTQNGTQKVKEKKSRPSDDQGLRNLFVDQLKDIYWAEKALTKAIPKMIENTTSEELADALTEHLEVTQNQVTRLEEVFSLIGEKAAAKKCEAMTGLIKEAEEIMKKNETGVVRDAAIILAAQKVEHYEIATYGTLCSFARTLEEDDAATLLQETLDEEREADEILSAIAESSINLEAAADEDEEEDEIMVAVSRKRN